jgi:hypothetical protein
LFPVALWGPHDPSGATATAVSAAQLLTSAYDFLGVIWFSNERAPRNAAFVINRLPGRIKHRDIRAIRSERFSHIPAAGRPDEVNIGEHYVDQHPRLANSDGFFAARGLDDGIACVPQTVRSVPSDEEFVLDQENDHAMITFCG